MSSSLALRGGSVEGHKQKIRNSDTSWKPKAKQPKRNASASLKNEKRPSYSPEFKAEILNFVKKNSKVIAVREFGIPESTLRDWISKDTTTTGDGDKKEAFAKPKHAENCVPNSSTVIKNLDLKCPLVIDQESLFSIVDIPSILIKKTVDQVLVHDVVTEVSTEVSLPHTATQTVGEELKQVSSQNKSSFGKEVQNEIVQYGVDHRSWKEAGSKYCVSPSTVQAWAKRAGVRLLAGRKSRMSMEEIIQYGVEQGSWKDAAVQYGVPLYTVRFWARKAGYHSQERKSRVIRKGSINMSHTDGPGVKLLKVMKSRDGMEEILQYGMKQNSGKEAAVKFGVSSSTKFWANKTGYKFQVENPRVNEKMMYKQLDGEKSRVDKEEILQFGIKQNSWKEAAVKFGVSHFTVQYWAQKAGIKLGKRKARMDMEEILQYGVKQNSWNEAAVKFGVSIYTVLYWAKKIGYRLNSKYSVKYSVDFKKTVVSFGEIEGCRAASRKFGVGAESVRVWTKMLCTKRRKPIVDEMAEQEIIKYGVKQNNWGVAALKDGVSEHTDTRRGGKAGHKFSSEKDKKVNPTRVVTDPANGLEPKVAAGVAEVAKRCEACGLMLAVNETFHEHVVSRHLTLEGLCDICGEDSADFIEHFQTHLKIQDQVLDPPPLDILENDVKEEPRPLDENQNCEVVRDVKEIKCEESEVEVGGRWVVNPFFNS